MSNRNLVLFGILKTKKEVYKLTKERISIGRNRTSQIVISNNTVSKDHAIIEFDSDNNAVIKDLNSSNGTYVNGQRLKFMPMRLKTGDKITFGKYDIEYTFEAFNINGESKTEPDMNNQYMINGNSFNNINNSLNNINNNLNNNLTSNENNKIIYDKKINLVNENEISFARMNHFQNNNTYNTFNENNNTNMNNNNNIKNDENLNNNTNNLEKSLQNKIEDLEKKNIDTENEKENLAKKNAELNEDLNKKINELKKMTNLFDELNEEYSKLNSKHNALMVYASDIQKKLDLANIEISQIKKKAYDNEEIDKIINEKENIISILQNEVNYYKKLCGKKINLNYNTFPMSDFNNNNININQKLDSLIDKYITENKKLKNQNELYAKKIKQYQKKDFENKLNKNIDFSQFETQINYQIDNFNSIIKEYNERLSESLNKISELFEDSKKEEAAKYLVEQINNYMQENQRLISENAKLNTQIIEYQEQLNSYNNINLNMNKINNIKISEDNEDNVSDNEIENLKNKIDELENIITKFKGGNNNNLNEYGINNGDNRIENINIREAFVNMLNELKEKDKVINELQNKLKDNIMNENNNYDYINSKINTIEQNQNK
jgi:pSer/pThr/pTyr-binding forkhead associated (FHA) protein